LDFVHLHVHSHYSPDGVASVRDLVRYAERLGMRALALTDQDTLAGIASFCSACRDMGIRPVIGCDMTIVPIAQSSLAEERPFRLVLLAETEAGYRNLVSLVNIAHAHPKRVRIDLESLEKHAGGLIALTGNSSSELYHLLLNNRIEETENYIRKLARIFGRDNLVFQIEDVESARQKQINDKIFSLSDFLGVRCAATNAVCYLRPEDSLAYDFLVGGRFPSYLQFKAAKDVVHSRHLASGMQMRDRFMKYPRALYATEEVADRCSFQPNYQKRRFPVHDFVRGFDADSFLWDLAFREARARFVELSPEMKNRLNEEFDYIKSHGLSNNMLLLWNIAQFVRKNKISVGVGRGDMITSLVAYILGITRINPLDYKMRFLGFSRDTHGEPALSVEMPVRHIENLHDFMRETFGPDFCSAVGKYTVWQRQGLGREVRAWLYAKPGRQDGESETPERKNLTVDSPIEEFFPGKTEGVALPSSEFENFLLSRLLPRPKELVLDENQFAISSENLNHLTPRVPVDDQLVTQMDGNALDLFHIPRITVITDPVLNILDSAAGWVRKEENAAFDPDRIPMDDEATFSLLSRGLTNGIEPFSSITLKSLLRAHRPRTFMDLLKIKGMEKAPNSEAEGDVRDYVPECLLTYRCAYVKAHYPMSFMASLLTHTFWNRRKFTVILREAKQMSLKILPPDINLSVYEFSQVHKAIRTGLQVVSGMTSRAYAELNDTRKGGDFNDLMDLVRRTDPKLINNRLLANLVKAGALDSFGYHRSQMLYMIEHDPEILRRDDGAAGMFDEQEERPQPNAIVEPPNLPEMPLPEIIRNEIAAAGYCIGFDQLLLYKELVDKCRALAPADLVPRMVGKEVYVAGFLDHVEGDSPLVEDREHILLDLEGHVVTMPFKISKLYDLALHASAPVLIGGTVHRRKDEVYVKGTTAFTLRMVQEMSQNIKQVELDLSGEDARTLRLVKGLVGFYKGAGTSIRLKNVPQGAMARWFARSIERTPVFFSPPFYYALKKILPEQRILVDAEESLNPALLNALSPLRYEKDENSHSYSSVSETDASHIVDVY